jgi:hypothetical protein
MGRESYHALRDLLPVTGCIFVLIGRLSEGELPTTIFHCQ